MGAALPGDRAFGGLDALAETQRLDALHRYLLLDSAGEDAFDLLTEAAAEICGAPYATVSLVDRDRVWIKSGRGVEQGRSVPRAQACCSHTVVAGDFLEIPDLSADARTAAMGELRAELGVQMYAGASLVTADGHRIGTLCVMDREPRRLSDRQRRILRGLARQAMALVELRAHEGLLKAALARAEHLAATDALTGLPNRRVLFERLHAEVERARRYGSPLSAVLVDLDHFKRINDMRGHRAGDTVLRAVGSLIGKAVRSSDVAARYGGEEFCILLTQTAADGAKRFAELLRESIASLTLASDGQPLTVTASIGVATLAPAPAGDDPQALLKAADIAMYRAKREGRDRVVVAAA